MTRLSLFIFIAVVLCSCSSPNDSKTKSKNNVNLKWTQGFTIDYEKDYKVITLYNAWKGEKLPQKYILYNDEKPKGIDGTFIKIPIKKIACTSLTHLAFIEKLNRENTIVGVSGCDLVTSPNISSLVVDGSIVEIGSGLNLDKETLLRLNPDMILGFGIDPSTGSYIHKLSALGLSTVLNSEYMEPHPLGKAEWIKFVAAFYNLEQKADSIFSGIEQAYFHYKQMTDTISKKPSVFSGMPWKGTWYVPGGRSFQAQLFKDAGANYIWSNNNELGSMVLANEVVINEAYDSNYWLNLNSFSSIQEVIAFNTVFSNFSAVKHGKVYNNNSRLNGNGGNDYWESGVISPHIILKDLVEIFHPQLLEHELYFYKKME